MNYRSLSQLNSDVMVFAQQLPRDDFDSVVGVPRSGLLPATLLAKYLNCPMGCTKRTLLVDDSLLKGRTLREWKDKINPCRTAVVYLKPGMQNVVDYFYETVDSPRFFEWNLWHHPRLRDICMDIDGLLCRDPTTEENDNGPCYERFIETVKPRIIPQSEIGWLVTCRLEKYRAMTQAWLGRYGIRYKYLVMCNHIEIRRRRKHARYKARAYDWTDAILFVESSSAQARQMKQFTRKPVLDMERGRLV